MKTNYMVLFACILLMSACSGGGNNDSNSSGGQTSPPPPPTPSETAAVAGSVAGTSLIAVNASGDIVAIDDTGGRNRDIDSDNNGTLDAFSFLLNEIPLMEDIRVYLVSGGNIYPMYFDSTGDGQPDSNVFAFSSEGSGELSLGFVAIDSRSGYAVASVSPTSNQYVSARGVVDAIPLSLNTPPTDNLSVEELNVRGANAVSSGWILGARTYYQAAADLVGNGSGNDADTARFMLALTRVAALGFDTLSDGNAQDKGRVGDFLDLFGVANNRNRANWSLLVNVEIGDREADWPNDSPTGDDVGNFTYDVITQELANAVEYLDAVSSEFDTVLRYDEEDVNIDSGDALFLGGFFRSLIASLAIERAYALDIDIDDVTNNGRSVEDVRNENPAVLGMPDVVKYGVARDNLSVALERIKSALDAIRDESDDQSDDLITIDEETDIGEVKTWIDESLASIEGTSTNIGRVAVDLQAFFNNGIILDDTTLPSSRGNGIDNNDGFFDDPTLGGVIVDLDTNRNGIQDLNQDENDDGVSDFVQ